MVQWETDPQVLGKCPCGQGEVICDVETPDYAHSRTHFTHRISCVKCSPLYTFSGYRNEHRGSFTLHSEETEKSRLISVASDLAKPIHARLVPQVQQAINKQGKTMAKWQPLAITLLGASDDFEAFRKDVRSYGNISSWVSSRVTPDRFLDLATLMADTQLLPLVHQFLEASARSEAFVVQRIPMVV